MNSIFLHFFNMLFRRAVLLINREEGQTLPEYGLIIFLIAIVCIAALTLLGGNITALLNQVAGAL